MLLSCPDVTSKMRGERGRNKFSHSRKDTLCREPCLARLRGGALTENIQDQLCATGDTQLVVNLKQGILHSVLCKVHLFCDLLIGHSLCDQSGNFVFALCQQIDSN